MKVHTRFNTIVGVLPASKLKNFLLRRGGWHIAAGVSVHPSLFVGVERVRLLSNSSVGSFNVFRHIRCLTLGEDASIAQFNWVTGGAPGIPNAASFLRLEAHSAITSRHYLDVSGGLSMGCFATLAGERSVVLTHEIDYRTSKRSLNAVTIGNYCLVSSSVNIVPGTTVPNFSVVAMGAVVTPGLTEEKALYAGVPATLKRKNIDGEYFHRAQGSAEPDLVE